MNRPGLVGTLGRQYVIIAISRVFAVGLLGTMAAMHLTY
jgi:hypothetical protein